MKYITNPALGNFQLDFLTEKTVANIVLNGKFETFDLSSSSSPKTGNDETLHNNRQQRPRAYSCGVFVPERAGRKRSSSLGDLSKPSARKLFLNLISTLNEAFSDYDFALTRQDQFVDSDVSSAMAEVNGFLSELTVDDSNVLEKLWKGLDDVINLMACEVFSYQSRGEDAGPFTEGTLWSFNYFFYNEELKRICFFSCLAVSKLCKMHYPLTASDDSDYRMDENDDDLSDEDDHVRFCTQEMEDDEGDEDDVPDWDGVI